MISKVTQCSICSKTERTNVLEPGETKDDIRNYRELVTYESCPKCKNSPEAKLLRAIYGGD